MSKEPEKEIKQPTETKEAIPTPIPKPSPEGQREALPIPLPKPSKRELVDYIIRGEVDNENLMKLPKEVPMRAYAVRNRKVLGSALIHKDGKFEIKYKYFTMKRNPYGVNIIVGPDLPGDQILKMKLERTFLSSKGFKKVGETS